MNKVSLAIRKITVPSVFAALLLTTIYIVYPEYFGSVWQLIAGLLFLTILPVTAYPLQKYIPKYADRGREGQRGLAMLFSALGYLLGAGTAFLTAAPVQLKLVYTEYLFCGIAMLVFNKIFKMKASGHACGIVGPVLLLVYFRLFIPALVGVVMITPVFVSSIRTKQHTVPQLIGGSIIPAVMLMIVHILLR